MIIFSITNTTTQQNYVGTTKNCASERWEELKAALPMRINAPLYNDMREYGVENFTVREFARAEDREEMKEYVEDAILELNAINLQGMKTRIFAPKPTGVKASHRKPSVDEITKAILSKGASRNKPATQPTPAVQPSKVISQPTPKAVIKPSKVAQAPKVTESPSKPTAKETLAQEAAAREKVVRDAEPLNAAVTEIFRCASNPYWV